MKSRGRKFKSCHADDYLCVAQLARARDLGSRGPLVQVQPRRPKMLRSGWTLGMNCRNKNRDQIMLNI